MPIAEKFSSLEIPHLLKQLAGYAGSLVTRDLIEQIDVVYHPSRIEENLDQTAEAVRFLNDNPNVELANFSLLEDLTGLWELIAAGELIDSQQARLLLRFFDVCHQFNSLNSHLPLDKFPRLGDVAIAWQPVGELASAARKIFNEDGEVRDGASSNLKRVREQIRKFETEADRSVRDILKSVRDQAGDEAHLALRGNRFVILMPRSLSTQFKGSVVDISGSGQSIYFEPDSVATLNADRQHLFLEEDQEVRIIKREFGKKLASYSEILRANLAIMVRYDYIFARAKYANALNGSRPEMNHGGSLSLRQAVHPLLLGEFIPEDLDFEDASVLIVSGVNAGGKTVLLKLIAVYNIMACLGCFVPGKAVLPYISGIMADIGDDQSALNNLSTFTAHLRFIKELWEELDSLDPDDPPMLVLIDEIGTGTEPGEGAAFAYGLITSLLEHPVKLAVTTHFDVLKTLAFEYAGVKNVCLEFDREQLKPTYRVLDNQPGASYALDIAGRFGIDPGVVESARGVLGKEESKMASIISELESLKMEAEATAKDLQEKSSQLEDLRADNEQLALELKRAKQRFVEHSDRVRVELEKKIDDLLDETKQKLKSRARKSTRKGDEFVKAASESAKLARQQKEELAAQISKLVHTISLPSDEKPAQPEFTVGALVFLAGSAIKGRIIELVPQKKQAVLEAAGKRITAKLSNLSLLDGGVEDERFDPLAAYRGKSKAGKPAPGKGDVAATPEVRVDSIDLHGLTVEEAREELEVFLSRCLQLDIGQIRINHGVGTGRLKAFVKDFLTSSIHVASHRQADSFDGGVGVTIADLK